jgi:outer membrane immunogenic protein
MKKSVVGVVVATFGFVGLASAADMPVKAPMAPAVIPYSWTGFYVGANVGYTWGAWDASASQIIFDPSTTHNAKVNGALGGLQLGYNWQAGSWVYGLEGDIQITGAKDTDNWSIAGLPPVVVLTDFLPGPAGGGTITFTNEWKLPWFATFRGRLGITPMPMLLLYATGGLAVAESKYAMTFSQPGAPVSRRFYSLSDDTTRIGFAVGAGVEKAFDRHWSVKAEYLYIDLGTRTINTVDIDGVPFQVSYKIRDHIARLGVNYKF